MFDISMVHVDINLRKPWIENDPPQMVIKYWMQQKIISNGYLTLKAGIPQPSGRGPATGPRYARNQPAQTSEGPFRQHVKSCLLQSMEKPLSTFTVTKKKQTKKETSK